LLRGESNLLCGRSRTRPGNLVVSRYLVFVIIVMAFQLSFSTFAPLRLVAFVQFITVCFIHRPSLLFVIAFRHYFSSLLFFTSFRHCFSSQVFVTAFRHYFLLPLFVTAFRHYFSSLLFVAALLLFAVASSSSSSWLS
jgi:hypothetical protein